jgi:hypothetical protein
MRIVHAAALILLLAVIQPGAAFAQTDQSGSSQAGQTGHAGDERQFMREVAAHEIAAQKQDHSLWQYTDRERERDKTTLCEVVETDQGSISRVIALNGQPLTPEQAHKEDARIHKLISDPEELHDQQRKARHDGEMERRLLQMLPDAFIYHSVGLEGTLTKLDFAPNPSFHPSTREGEVFHHMDGSIWVNAQAKRIARIEGHLASEVKFGGGILGHLSKGGTFSIEQQNVGEGHWDLVRVDVDMNGRALFFKTISVHQQQEDSHFKSVPAGITLQQAAQLLNEGAKQLAGRVIAQSAKEN